jgi:hypothetical protein
MVAIVDRIVQTDSAPFSSWHVCSGGTFFVNHVIVNERKYAASATHSAFLATVFSWLKTKMNIYHKRRVF